MTDNLIENLKALGKRSPASRLSELMPVIDEQIKRGVSHEDILTTLHDGGINVNVHTFRTSLYRYRKSVREAEKQDNVGKA